MALQRSLSKSKSRKQRPEENHRQEWRTKMQRVISAFCEPANRTKGSTTDHEKALVIGAPGRSPNEIIRAESFPNELAIPPPNEEFSRVIE